MEDIPLPDDTDEGYVNDRLRYYKTKTRQLSTKVADLVKKTQLLDRRYQNKLRECRENLARYQETVDLLKAQRQEFEVKFNDPNFSTFSSAIINSVSVNDFIRIRDLVDQGKIDRVLRSRKLLRSLQKLMIGLSYGVVPVVVPQRKMLTDNDRDLIKQLEGISLEQIKQVISDNTASFTHIFNVISDSINFLKLASS